MRISLVSFFPFTRNYVFFLLHPAFFDPSFFSALRFFLFFRFFSGLLFLLLRFSFSALPECAHVVVLTVLSSLGVYSLSDIFVFDSRAPPSHLPEEPFGSASRLLPPSVRSLFHVSGLILRCHPFLSTCHSCFPSL